ncbi:MAG: trypsin-like serine protease [Verrucomicrobiota bacterium]
MRRFILTRKHLAAALLITLLSASRVHAILAGDENALPADSPANRLDTLGAASPFNAIGSLSISADGFSYIGSATAISPDWVLTAGHNLDVNDAGSPTPGLNVSFNLPGFGSYSGSTFYTCPGFTGFGNPSIQRDLGLIHLANPLPNNLLFPTLSGHLQTGTEITLAGFGRSGYGSYGYTTFATLTDRRSGQNTVDTLISDDQGGGFAALFQYTFNAPNTGDSLGNNIETIIGPGDSGGPALVADGSGYAIVGVNTYVDGYGGRFGDIGGGIVLAPYVDWINNTMAVPEPSATALMVLGLVILLFRPTHRARIIAER